MSTDYDVLVIGAGAGGLFAAARLASRPVPGPGRRAPGQGRRTRVHRRGRRFKVNDGAIVIEVGGITEQTCKEVGADFDIREPRRRSSTGSARRTSTSPAAAGVCCCRRCRARARRSSAASARPARTTGLPEHEQTLEQWLNKYTKNESVHGIFRNMCASIFAVGSDELPARVFLTYFTRKSAFKRFGYHPEGTIGLWRALADAIDRERRRDPAVHRGGELAMSDGLGHRRARRRQHRHRAGGAQQRRSGRRRCAWSARSTSTPTTCSRSSAPTGRAR